jgi:cytochrome d ubiquinol oxidase subunit I
MVAIGFLFLFVMLWALVLVMKGRVFESRPFLWTLVVMQPLGWVAVELGWVTTEVGRQPWLVYGLVRTAEGVSPIWAGNVVWSLSLFLIVFLTIGGAYLYYVLKAFRRGPDMESPIPPVQKPAGMRMSNGPGVRA